MTSKTKVNVHKNEKMAICGIILHLMNPLAPKSFNLIIRGQRNPTVSFSAYILTVIYYLKSFFHKKWALCPPVKPSNREPKLNIHSIFNHHVRLRKSVAFSLCQLECMSSRS